MSKTTPEKKTPGARRVGKHFYANVRFGKGKRLEFRVPAATSLEETSERAQLIGDAAKKLAAIGRRDLVRGFARQLAEATTAQRLARVQKAIDVALRGAFVATSHDITFEEWARRYTSGDLAREFPDSVKGRNHSDDVSRLNEYILKHVGDVPIVSFEWSHSQIVMSKLPPMSEANRRQVAQIMGRLMHLAVLPGRLIKASPLPRGWLPKVTKRRHFSCLFPGEEQQLLEDQEIPEVFRLFCGVLNREGMRLSMLLDSDWFQWGDVGTFTSGKTKTNDPHLVAIRPDTAAAMRLWREKQKLAGNLGERPFAGVLELVASKKTGKPDRTKIAEYFRAALRRAGIDREELFTSTEFTGALRAHDMRATFVTISLAEGKTETWIRDRTSHKSTSMIDRYRRLARQVGELELGSLCNLVRGLGWWKGGGSEVAEGGPAADSTGENPDEEAGVPHPAWTAEPKFGRAAQSPAVELISRWKSGLRDDAKPPSTTLPPPLSRPFTPPTADQDGEGSDHIARAPTSNSPGPARAVPRHGPASPAESRLVGAQRGAAALAVGWDVLEVQVAALVAGGDDGDGGDR